MVKITDAKRIVKRIILSNITTDKKDLSLTPLISERHGIGKSMIVKQLAEEINGSYITIEGGSLKEGEITGLPYQYKDEDNKIKFRFLPYYAVERIQNKEKEIFLNSKKEIINVNLLSGDENKYSLNNISSEEKVSLILNKKIQPVIIFFDEINRSDPQVYKELMNILLTRQVNGYVFPWWVFFIGAMNPSSSDSSYMTNEMDPAQLDRFIKIDVKANSNDFLLYAKEKNFSPIITSFIKENREDLIASDKSLEADIESTPSPRGYDMLDTILNSFYKTSPFFTKEENSLKMIQNDFKEIAIAKLGNDVGKRFYEHFVNEFIKVSFSDFINDDNNLNKTKDRIIQMNIKDQSQLGLDILNYLSDFSSTLSSSWSLLSNLENKIKIYLKSLSKKLRIQFAYDFSSSTTRKGIPFTSVYHDIYFDLIQPIFKEEQELKDSFN